jgi:hypothetical protein
MLCIASAWAMQNTSPPSAVDQAMTTVVAKADGVDGVNLEALNISSQPITAFCLDLTWHYASGETDHDGSCNDLALGLAIDTVPGANRKGTTFRPGERQSVLFYSRRGGDGSQPIYATSRPRTAIFEDRTAVGDPKDVQTITGLRRSGGAEMRQVVDRLQVVISAADPGRSMQAQLDEVAVLRARRQNSVAEEKSYGHIEAHLKKMRDYLPLGAEPFGLLLKIYSAQATYLAEHSILSQRAEQ